MSRRVAVVGLAFILTGLLFAGCGLEGQPFSTATDKSDRTDKADSADASGGGFNPSVVTAEAIAQFPTDSPEAAALGWWRGVQTRDPDAVLNSYSAAARDELPKKFPIALVTAVSPPAATSPIRVADVESDGDSSATVYVVIDSENPMMNGPLALPMEKTDGEWKITDPIFLGSLVDSYFAVAKAVKKAAADGGQ